LQNQKVVYSWGRNTHGQLGLGSVCHSIVEPTMLPFFEEHRIKNIVCGEKHTLILDDKGNVYACGCPGDGKLGLGFMTTLQTVPKKISLKNVTYIACGPNHSMALVEEITFKGKRTHNEKESDFIEEGKESFLEKKELKCYSWGKGFDYQLGHGDADNLYSPKMIETKYVFEKVACGTHHSAAITDEGKVNFLNFRNLFR
jgi:alpha-tubulin suppressor-like RCC1 family protein